MKPRLTLCALVYRYNYQSHQKSNSDFMWPLVKDAWKTNASTGITGWNFTIGPYAGCCAHAARVAHDWKESSFKKALHKAQQGHTGEGNHSCNSI